jgi:hypothetical protein
LNPGQGSFGDVFRGGLAPGSAPATEPTPAPDTRSLNPGQGMFGDVFGGGLAPGTTPAPESHEGDREE